MGEREEERKVGAIRERGDWEGGLKGCILRGATGATRDKAMTDDKKVTT